MKNFILVILAFIAFIFVLGSVGAYDNNTIGFGRLLIQCGIGILAIWLSLKETNK